MNQAEDKISSEIRGRCEIIRLDPKTKATFTPVNHEFIRCLLTIEACDFPLYVLQGWDLIEYIKPREFKAELVKEMLAYRTKNDLRICVRRDHFPRYEKIVMTALKKRMEKVLAADSTLNKTFAARYLDTLATSQSLVRGGLDQESVIRLTKTASSLVTEPIPLKQAVSQLTKIIGMDPLLYDHVACTTILVSSYISETQAFSKRESKLCVQASLLHDLERCCAYVGKPVVAGKVGEGSVDEINALIKNGQVIHESSVEVIMQNRERFDGSGYPLKLKGRLEEDPRWGIHPMARHVTLGCLFAELTIKRSEEKPLGARKILAYLEKMASMQKIDPTLVAHLVSKVLTDGKSAA